MAFLEFTYRSEIMKQDITFNALLPDNKTDGTYKTLDLYHGLKNDRSSWMRKSSIERYAQKYGIAVIMPGVDRSWYTDTATGQMYFSYVTKELPTLCRSYFKGMSDKREDNLVAGFSMGGYGAVKAALSCPETFGACASLSGVLDIASKDRIFSIDEWRGIFGFNLSGAEELRGTKHDIFALAKKNKESGIAFPKLYMWCGKDDHLVGSNRAFSKLLNDMGVEHIYEEGEGDHTWPYWDLHIQSALANLLT